MTIFEQLHKSSTHKVGTDPSCPICKRHEALEKARETARKIINTHNELEKLVLEELLEFLLLVERGE